MKYNLIAMAATLIIYIVFFRFPEKSKGSLFVLEREDW